MKILLLGATGQIGHALAEALSRTNHHLSVLVRSAKDLDLADNVTVIEQPVFSPSALATAMAHVDHVIYSLGPPEQYLFNASTFDHVHCGLLQTCLNAMRTAGICRMTYVSTYEVFEAIDGRIVETHPVTASTNLTHYSRSKLKALRIVEDFIRANDVLVTTIHPAAVYGGRNTSGGITDFIENLVMRKWYRVPFVNRGVFPVIHVDSLADLIVRSLDAPGAYLASDAMTTLPDLARSIRDRVPSHMPLVMQLPLVKLGAAAMEAMAPIVRMKPLIATGQIDFLTRGWTPDASKAMQDLGWRPMSLDDGLERFLRRGGFRTAVASSPASVAT